MGVKSAALVASLLSRSAALASSSPTTNKVCPILGPVFPKPSDISSSQAWKDASSALETAINNALRTGTSAFGDVPLNTSTFSLGVFSANDDGLAYQKHYTDPVIAKSDVGVRNVDADTVYRIGSTSKLFTVLSFLSKVGFRQWYDPITLYLPQELFDASAKANTSTGVLPRWDEITIADLASQLSGMSRDYGLDERGLPFPTLAGIPLEGLPTLSKGEIPVCGYGYINDSLRECTEDEFINGISMQPAAWADGRTPSYSNSAFDLLALVAENITGLSMSRIFHESLVQPLNLRHTFYDAPVDPGIGAIPYNTTKAGWDSTYGVLSPAGGNYINTNDIATISKAIMNNQILSPSATRRWLRPVSFQYARNGAVGAPWEITRWQTSNGIYDLYAKDGGLALYASLFILVPDLGMGVSLLLADATEPEDLSPIKYALADLTLAHLLPVVAETAKQQAAARFAGRYQGPGNTSVVIATDDQPGLRMIHWFNNGTDVLAELPGGDVPGTHPDTRLWPNDLYADEDCQIGFTATFAAIPRPASEEPLNYGCSTWGGVDVPTYGNVAMGHVVFRHDKISGRVTSLRLEALRLTLKKT